MDWKNGRIAAALRFPFLFLWFFASGALYSSACLLLGQFSKRAAQVVARYWNVHLLFMLGVRLTVRGAEKLAPGARYLFFANHQSALDIPVLYAGIGRPVSFIAKKELFWIPFFGWGLSAVGHVRIDRSSARRARDSLLRGVANLNKYGLSLILFPEGTRSPDGRLGEFKQGAFSVAFEAGVPVVPVAIRKTFECLPKKSFAIRRGTVYLDFCDPIDPAGMDRSGLAARVRSEIEKVVAAS